MVREAAEFENEDRKVRERVDARNTLESVTYSLRSQVNDKDKLGGKLSADEEHCGGCGEGGDPVPGREPERGEGGVRRCAREAAGRDQPHHPEGLPGWWREAAADGRPVMAMSAVAVLVRRLLLVVDCCWKIQLLSSFSIRISLLYMLLLFVFVTLRYFFAIINFLNCFLV
ncbi:putative Hsp70 protein [Trypanosoma vivax]|nr:putative Hsp70 protein [Trypanosoma vivax]